MIFHETSIAGAFLIEPEPHRDDRGFFARVHDEAAFEEHGCVGRFAQSSLSFSARRGTLRGMHWQIPPMGEAKYIRVINGAIQDVIVDLRPWSTSYLQHFSVELSAEERVAIYVPPYVAHGNQALTDNAEMLYNISSVFAPGYDRGFAYNDPQFGIHWPLEVAVISERDLGWTPLDLARSASEIAPAPEAPSSFRLEDH